MICWSCQLELCESLAVRLDAEKTLPCCLTCWEQIPAAQRLIIAQRFQAAPAAESAWRAITQLIQRHSLDEDSPPFLRGRG